MIFVGLVIGAALGSLPTADLLARRRGLDLRGEGSGNPGANNAFRLGGPAFAAMVLVLEIAKGAGAVLAGERLGGDPAAAMAGIGAAAGNVYNPWFRGRGGKGLAISAGVVTAAWPLLAAALVTLLAAMTALLRRSGPATLVTLGTYSAIAVAGTMVELPGQGVITDRWWMAALALVGSLLVAPKHLSDTLRPVDRPSSPPAG